MTREWDADIQLTAAAAVALIEQQFPALAPARLQPFGIGWDNVAYLVNDELVFRFPRRSIAANLLAREARILPLLAPHLPLPLPVPTYVGTVTSIYPFVFAGYALLPGQTACQVACGERERTALAPTLAGFLANLHQTPVDSATRQWAPGDEIERANLRKRAPVVKERLSANPAKLATPEVERLLRLVDDLATTPASTEASCWVHGDFYARHLLLDGSCRPTGVIDWGDVHLGDRAVDLSIAFSFLPPVAREVFRAAYGAIDEATWRRARFRAIHYGAILALYAADVGDATIGAIGEYALQVAPLDT